MRKKPQTNNIKKKENLNYKGGIKKRGELLIACPLKQWLKGTRHAILFYCVRCLTCFLVKIFGHFFAGNLGFVMDHRDQVALFI